MKTKVVKTMLWQFLKILVHKYPDILVNNESRVDVNAEFSEYMQQHNKMLASYNYETRAQR